MKERFGAVVLTMNKKDMALDCAKSLLKQNLKKIFIVNNGSVDGTRDFLEIKLKKEITSGKVKLINLEKNTGSAGGYYKGIYEAIKAKMDWVWLFDDDCEARKDSFKNLIKAKDAIEKDGVKIGFLASISHLLDEGFMRIAIRDKGPGYLKYLKSFAIELKWSVYTGMMINSKAVKKHGLPRRDMFLYEDDTEFTNRMLEDSYRGFLVGNSEILHKDYFSKRKTFTSKEKSMLHRQKYAIRNGVFFSRVLFKKDKIASLLHFIGILKNIFISILFSRNFTYSPVLLFYIAKGFFFYPKLEKFDQ
jgi:GT2 family glycosyltransferase